MSDAGADTYDIGEFVSFDIQEDDTSGVFTITLRGPMKFADLLAHKVGTLTFDRAELEYWVEDNGQQQ